MPTTIRQNVLNAMHDSGEHLPIRVKILVVVQACSGVVRGEDPRAESGVYNAPGKERAGH